MDLLGRKLGMKKGLYFMNVIGMDPGSHCCGQGLDVLKAEAGYRRRRFECLRRKNSYGLRQDAEDHAFCSADRRL